MYFFWSGKIVIKTCSLCCPLVQQLTTSVKQEFYLKDHRECSIGLDNISICLVCLIYGTWFGLNCGLVFDLPARKLIQYELAIIPLHSHHHRHHHHRGHNILLQQWARCYLWGPPPTVQLTIQFVHLHYCCLQHSVSLMSEFITVMIVR